jgi:hypothetical protein
MNKEDLIKFLEQDNSNYEIPDSESEESGFKDYKFDLDQIKEAINKVIEELNPNFSSLFDISIFLGNVAKNLTSTMKDENISFDTKYNILISISQTVCEELENRGLISVEMSMEFKEAFKDGQKYKDVLSSVSDFFTASKDKKRKILMNAFENVLSRFLE